VSPFWKKGNSKEAWLDWLSDDAPSQEAQAEMRRQHVRRANTYTPRQFTPQSGENPSLSGQAQPQGSAAPIQPRPPAQAVSQTSQAQPPRQAAPVQPQARTGQGSGVSIQINIPQLRLNWLRRLGGFFGRIRSRFTYQWAFHRPRVITISLLAAMVVASLLATPVLHLGTDNKGAASTAGATGPKYKKPPFTVVVPSSKPKLATPDGVHAAYDGNKNVYTYSDSIGQDGFVVSQQPIPDQFNTAEDAISSIGPKIYGPTATSHTVATHAGEAYVTVSSKGAQTVVFSVHNLLMFIQSSHDFSDIEIEDYVNLLQ
jgi:hypothetical protein